MGKKSVFVVESGVYSDRGIQAICATEEIAKKFCELFNVGKTDSYDSADYVGWEVLTELPEKYILYTRWATVLKDGSLLRDQEWTREYIGNEKRRITEAVSERLIGPRGGIKDEILVRVTGTDKSYVDKSFRDRVFQAQATLAGKT